MDLSTSYLGLKLKNPVIAAASPMTRNVDSAKELEKAGVAAVVLHSLFEEDLEFEQKEMHDRTSAGTDSFAESLSYFPDFESYQMNGEDYLELIRTCRKNLQIPVIASLNAIHPGSWADFASKIQDAGAHALELNIYFLATDASQTATQIENQYVEIVREVKKRVKIPVAVKISPFFSAFANFAARLVQAGADGIVLFNRFYQPDIDLDAMEVRPNILFSSTQEMRLPMRWVALLHGRIKVGISATSGIQSGEDVIKMVLAGTDTVQLASILINKGAGHVKTVVDQMENWMKKKGFDSLSKIKGRLSSQNITNLAHFERTNYMRALKTYR